MKHYPEISTNLIDNDLLYLPCHETQITLTVPLNGKTEEVAQQLQEFPPEAIQILTEAIAMWIGEKNKSPSNLRG